MNDKVEVVIIDKLLIPCDDGGIVIDTYVSGFRVHRFLYTDWNSHLVNHQLNDPYWTCRELEESP